MRLPEQANDSEKRLLKPLEDFFKTKWGNTRMWSHDLEHHRRVWNNARELLEHKTSEIITLPQEYTDKLLIACLLHDIGMAHETGEKHGRQSRKLCEEFLNSLNAELSTYEDMLAAVEHHDDKNYNGSQSPLLLILSAADDLDAFGYTGILRYFEIYMMRGMGPAEIGNRVLENSASRFANFGKNFGGFPDLVEKHRKRYLILRDFFQNFKEELASGS